MKKILYALTILAGFSLFWACEDENNNPVLDTTKIVAPTLTDNLGQTDVVLLKANATEPAFSFSWDSTQYPLSNIQDEVYSLQMDSIGNNFASPVELVNGDIKSYEITVAELNDKLLKMGYASEVPLPFEFRVYSYIVGSSQDMVYSNVISKNITAYSNVVVVEPIYILGSGTTIGWSNTDALPVVYLPESGSDSTFAIVETLTPGADQYIKFIRFLGAWAPQWGTDADGTAETGNLVYRPDESVADPAAIPVPDVLDDYLIKADIVNLTYTITETVQTLHIIGDATDAAWDAANAIPMEKLAPGKFQLVANLSASASEGFKFLELQGVWAPMYGQNGEGTWDEGKLQYRPSESVSDPSSIPPPPETGSYLIEVDIAKGTYKVTAQ